MTRAILRQATYYIPEHALRPYFWKIQNPAIIYSGPRMPSTPFLKMASSTSGKAEA
jgi:hypothetical protein